MRIEKMALDAQNRCIYSLYKEKGCIGHAVTCADCFEALEIAPEWQSRGYGSYLLREYAGSISDIEATQGGTQLNVIKSDKATFVLANTSGDRTPVTIRYALSAVDPSVRKTWISQDRAFISGAAAFLQISG